MTDVTSIINQLEQQRSSIDRAIEALRTISAPVTTERPVRSTSVAKSAEPGHISADGRQRLAEAMKRRWAAKRAAAKKSAGTGTATKGRSVSAEQKRAISKSWTPERKQKFAEFHVRRMARERGEDPAKALREYRRRKQKEQSAASASKITYNVSSKEPRKSAPKKAVAKTATAGGTSA